MGRTKKIVAGAVLLGLTAFGLGWQLRGRSVSKVDEALGRIHKSYVDGVSGSDLEDAALRGAVQRLDRNSEYFTPDEWRRYEERQIKARYGGIGVEVEGDAAKNGLRIVAPIEGSPAFEAGLQKNDVIVEVDGRSLQGLPQDDAVDRIRGPSGSAVTLTVRRDERTFQVTLHRYLVRAKSVRARMVEDGVGYVRITDFVEMMDLFDAEVAKLREQGAKALVIDLRGNRGGLLTESVALADRFLDDGVIVTIHGRGTPAQEYRARRDDTMPPMPLAVLVDGDSASASEIFAAAIQEHGRGSIVGSRTYGKGTVQTPFPLSDGSRLKLTTARYTTPRGRSVQREEGRTDWGVAPNLQVEMSAEESRACLRNDPGSRDYPLEEATELVRAALQKRPPVASSRILKAGSRSGS